MAWVMDGHVWSGYFRRNDGSGGRVGTSRLEETTAEKRHLDRLVCGVGKPIEMKWDAERVCTVQMTDGWSFLSEEDGSESNALVGDVAPQLLGYKPRSRKRNKCTFRWTVRIVERGTSQLWRRCID